YWLDVELFRSAFLDQSATHRLAEYQAALDLYQGEFLAGFAVRNAPVFEEWVIRQREELHSLVLQGLYRVAEQYHQQHEIQAGLAMTQRLLALEPWHEAGHRLQMQLFTASGQRAAALAQYALCQRTLAEELGVEPEVATTTLYVQIRNGTYEQVTPKQPLFQEEGMIDDRVSLTDDRMARADADHLHLQFPNHLFMPTFPSPFTTEDGAPIIDSCPHNLPNQLTPFFGREAEIADLAERLREAEDRLITLIGEGGVGKTRLALAVGQTIVDCQLSVDDSSISVASTANSSTVHRPLSIVHCPFPDGVWFVSLSGMTATAACTDQLAVAVAQAIGAQFSSNQPLLAQLLAYLRHKTLLLLFDNAEHLLPEFADFLVQLLRGSPHIRVLVTSRHVLNLQAEVIWRVTGLPVPSRDDLEQLTPAGLMTYSSIALFCERAGRVTRNCQLTTENSALVVAICRLVEGLPLALELAATLTKQYGLAEIYTALQSTYTILATTMRDLSHRHRSIKATLEHSWRLLSPQEVRVLAAFTIFHGGFTLEAAAAVTGAPPALLTTLVNQSLLRQVQDEAGNSRYEMHTLVRQYAAEQLQGQPAAIKRWQEQHCAYYLTLLTRQTDLLVRDRQVLQKMQMDLDNLRAAWTWATDQAALNWLEQSCHALAQFYQLVSFYAEAEVAFGRAVAQLQTIAGDGTHAHSDEAAPFATAQERLLAQLQVEQAHACARLAQFEKAERLAQTARHVGETLTDYRILAQAALCVSLIHGSGGNFAGVRTAAEAAVGYARQGALPDLEAAALSDLGSAYLALGDVSYGLAQLHHALTVDRRRNFYVEAGIYTNLGAGYQMAGDFLNARRYLQHALDSYRSLNFFTLASTPMPPHVG
ncbi:MAG: BTAD domain-containing putative transcriptional regulator, partial [Caldilineaceae bacterium]